MHVVARQPNLSSSQSPSPLRQLPTQVVSETRVVLLPDLPDLPDLIAVFWQVLVAIVATLSCYPYCTPIGATQ